MQSTEKIHGQFGLQIRTIKPKGYWDDINTVIKEIKIHFVDLLAKGDFPGSGIIHKKMPGADIIISKHGGIRNLAKSMGYESKTKPSDYWSLDTIIKEIKTNFADVLAEGSFPSVKMIGKKLKGVRNHIWKIGICNLAKMMGYELKSKHKGYWSINTIINKIEDNFPDLIANKSFPTSKMIKEKIGETGYNVIFNKFGTISKLAEIMGCQTTRKSNGYWNNLDIVIREIKSNFADILAKGSFPTIAIIEKKIPGACGTIYKNGGIVKLSELMGYKYNHYIKTSDNHYVQSCNEYLVDEYLNKNGISHEVSGLISPDKNYRYDFKVGDYYIEVWGYGKNDKGPRGCRYNARRKKKEILYRNLDIKLISLEKSFFDKSTEDIFKELDKIFTGLNIPTKQDSVIGVDHLRYWNDEKVVSELKKIWEETGSFPSLLKLTKMKRSDLKNGIRRNGGIMKFRKLLSCEGKRKPAGYWNDETIKKELLLACEKFNKFPQWYELFRDGQSGLAAAITSHGGVDKFRKLLGYPPCRKKKE